MCDQKHGSLLFLLLAWPAIRKPWSCNFILAEAYKLTESSASLSTFPGHFTCCANFEHIVLETHCITAIAQARHGSSASMHTSSAAMQKYHALGRRLIEFPLLSKKARPFAVVAVLWQFSVQ